MKKCNKCEIEKNLSDYYKDKSTKDGYYTICKLCKKKNSKTYSLRSKEEIYASTKIWKENNKEHLKKYNKNWTFENKEHIKDYNEKSKKRLSDYYKNRKKNDKLFKLKENVRRLIYNSIYKNGFSKKTKTCEILGCSYEEFKIYIENKFEPWMNWENHGKYTGNNNETWQYDHIIPLDFAKTEEELIKLNHFSNVRPFCSKLNLEKSNKINGKERIN